MSWSRRRFLSAATGAAGLAGGWAILDRARIRPGRPPIEGTVVGPSEKVGHRLLDRPTRKPDREKTVGVVIVGGGMSGLGAAWKLERSGFSDLVVLELEPRIGGTSAWGESPETDYPWGAHYIPFPPDDARVVRELLFELGAIEGYRPDGQPIYNERHVCFAPQERLYLHGRWQEGLFPSLGARTEDTAQHRRFVEIVTRYRTRRDQEGRRPFALPIELSSREPDLMELDTISMAEFLARHKLDSKRLAWYVEYCCRDDYGTSLQTTSAWVGLHYFASRSAGEEGQVLTWPEGNGWVTRRLAGRLKDRVVTGRLVRSVEPDADHVTVDCEDGETGEITRYRARAAIMAVPKFVLKYVARGLSRRTLDALGTFTYAPWVVANLHVDRIPEGVGAPPCWDNVIYDSPSLGYVTATHQRVSTVPGPSVLTYYRSFFRESPAVVRQWLLETPWETWRRVVLSDLATAHPDLESSVKRLDVMLLAHAMVRPTVGFVWGEARRAALELPSRLHAAHCDTSGLPLFEEALYRGVSAAESVMRQLGVAHESSLTVR